MKLFLFNLLFFLLPTLADAFFCPNNFNQINFGNTIEQVQQQCGIPAKQDKKEVTPELPTMQEWNYFIPKTFATSATNQSQMTLKTQITFDDKGKTINISVNGLSVASTTACGNGTLQLGDTTSQVEAICGKPSFINKQSISTSSAPPTVIKVTEFTYNTTPPVTLVFENGVLTQKK